MTDDILGGFKYGSKTVNLVNGIDKNWVGVSTSHLEGEDKVKADQYLAEAKAKFEALEKDTNLFNWLSSGRVSKEQGSQEVTDIPTRLNDLASAINNRG
ncbi:hypothetical protein [Mycoplasma struthionis]|nr:hypothetical protein [Mycoplasma struthionis]